METEKKVLRADRYIRQHSITDEDMKQDIYLASLMSDTAQAFSRRAKAIMSAQTSTSVEEVSLEEVLEEASTEDEAMSLMALVCEEQEQRDLRELRLDLLSEALDEALDRLFDRRAKEVIRAHLEGSSLKELSDRYGCSKTRVGQLQLRGIRKLRCMSGIKELLALLLEL